MASVTTIKRNMAVCKKTKTFHKINNLSNGNGTENLLDRTGIKLLLTRLQAYAAIS
jgi:hypothetical protein